MKYLLELKCVRDEDCSIEFSKNQFNGTMLIHLLENDISYMIVINEESIQKLKKCLNENF